MGVAGIYWAIGESASSYSSVKLKAPAVPRSASGSGRTLKRRLLSRLSFEKGLHHRWPSCTVSPERNGTDGGMSMAGKRIDAIAYLRTSSAANVGSDKDSDKRQRAAIASFAKAHGYRIVDEFYDAAVSGADPVTDRPGFKAMLDRIAGNGVRVVLVESPDRFARDLAVQLTGHDYLRSLGVELVPTSAPDFFTTDTPTAVLVRQVLGAV